MPSAADRVFSIPELMEMILLSLPARTDGLPDIQLFPLQRVNQSFRDAINRPGSKILGRMLPDPSDSPHTALVFSQLPLRGTPFNKACQIPLTTFIHLETRRPPHDTKGYGHRTYLFSPSAKNLLTWRMPPNLVQFINQDISDLVSSKLVEGKFPPNNASWRRLSLLSTRFEAIFPVHLPDDGTKAYWEDPERELCYRFNSGGDLPTLTIGDLANFMTLIGLLTEEQHVELEREAIAKRKRLVDAHWSVLNELPTYFSKLEERPPRCDMCAWMSCCRSRCLLRARSRRDTYTHEKSCSVCRATGCRGSECVSICWPMDRDFFLKMGVIDEQGVLVIKE